MDLLDKLRTSLADRYTIDRQIGAGGMANVYLARDLRHDRPVALKLLSPELGAVLGPERFLSEIRVTANLQHPNLLPLFDSGEAGGQLYYVMPYVAGETLRVRLQRERQLPVEEAIHLTTAVASALDYAHRNGVIHRDLKPENILLHDGEPLVADFGIALAVSNAGGERVTQSGLSLGTPQYMSPEQATGDRVIDARTDVYSLGAVLYEMLTGDPPHTGSTAQAIIARLLTERPRSVRGIRPAVPEHVEAAVQKALEKLPADRFATPRQFADALMHAGPLHITTAAIAKAPSDTRLSGRSKAYRLAPVLATVAMIVAIAASAVAVWQWRQRDNASADTAIRLTVPMEAGQELDRSDFVRATIAPDGERIVYVVSNDGKTQLYLKSLSDLEGRPVPGTEGAVGPFFSADSKSIAFYSGTKLVRVPLVGGTPTTITETVRPDNATWLADNTILIPTSAFTGGRSGLSVVSAGGGTPRAVFRSDSAKGENHATPIVLADGETVLFNSNGPSGYDDDHIAIGSLKSGKYTALDIIANRVVGFLEGLLIYLREDGVLMAVPADIGGQRATGDPFPLIEGIADGWNATVSDAGSLLYVEGQSSSTIVLADARGVLRPLLPEARQYASPRVSPDGRRIAMTIGLNQSDVWIAEIASGTMTRLSSGNSDQPAWTPDGRRVAFRSRKAGQASFLWVPADGSAPAEQVPIRLPPGAPQEIVISPDGRTAFYRISSKRRSDLYYSTIGGNDPPHEFAAGAPDEITPRFSPDGRWVAYVSDESAVREVYVKPFPGPGGRVQISSSGGQEPVWARDGETLYYRDARGVMAVKVSSSATFEIVSRTPYVRGNFATIDRSANYDVTPDGQELLMLQPVGQQSRMVWVVNWISELRARIAAEKR